MADFSSGDVASNSTGIVCEELPTWGVPVGIAMGVVGSIGINIGQNLQATGLAAMAEEDRAHPHRSRMWRLGMAIFVLMSLVNFAALALAPASILTPLESLQFVTNIFYNRFVNKKVVSYLMVGGVTCALTGTVFAVVFGPPGGGSHSIDDLATFWAAPTWWVWFLTTLSIAAGAFAINVFCTERAKKGHRPKSYAIVLPISFTLASALGGGSQLIVHAKAISVLLSQLFQGDVAILASWLFYVELSLVIACGVFWIVRLTECLALFDPLLILPLMIGSYVLFGAVAGGIFYQEFANMALGPAGEAAGWALFVSGLLLVLAGLGMIATASVRIDLNHEAADAAKVDAAAPGSELPPPDLAPPLPRPPPLKKQLSDALDDASERSRRLHHRISKLDSLSAAEPASPLARVRMHLQLDRLHMQVATLTDQLSSVAEVAFEGSVHIAKGTQRAVADTLGQVAEQVGLKTAAANPEVALQQI